MAAESNDARHACLCCLPESISLCSDESPDLTSLSTYPAQQITLKLVSAHCQLSVFYLTSIQHPVSMQSSPEIVL